MWWKIYFWIYLILSIIGIFGYMGLQSWNFMAWIEVIFSILGLIAVWSYVFKKPIFTTNFWKAFIWINVGILVFSLIYSYTSLEDLYPMPSWLMSPYPMDGPMFLFSLVLGGPMLYAIYKLGYPTKIVAPARKPK